MQIRPLEPHAVTLHRELRLRALRDAPDSFGVTCVDTEAQPPSYWETLACALIEPGGHVMFLAWEGDTVCGWTYGFLDRQRGNAGCDGV
jgi:hypothetical protein